MAPNPRTTIGLIVEPAIITTVVTDTYGQFRSVQKHPRAAEFLISVRSAVLREIAQLTKADAPIPELDLKLAFNCVKELLPPKTNSAVGLICTKGFRDSLAIGHGWKGDPWDIHGEEPIPLTSRHLRLGVTERVDATGAIVTPLDPADVLRAIDTFRQFNVTAIAVCLFNSFQNQHHETLVQKIIAQAWPEAPVLLSSRLAPMVGEYERTVTTVLSAYVTPVFRMLVADLKRSLQAQVTRLNLFFLQANGGFIAADDELIASTSLLAGGVTDAVAVYEVQSEPSSDFTIFVTVGEENITILPLDKGGPKRVGRLEIQGYDCFLPTLKISQAPMLAGLDAAADLAVEEAALKVASAIRRAAIYEGWELAKTPVIISGLNGPRLAQEVANWLQIPVKLSKQADQGPAFGLLQAPFRVDLSVTFTADLADALITEINQRFQNLIDHGTAKIERCGIPADQLSISTTLYARYRGEAQPLPLTVTLPFAEASREMMATRFHEAHRDTFGHSEVGAPVEIAQLGVGVSNLPYANPIIDNLDLFSPCSPETSPFKPPEWLLRDAMEYEIKGITQLMDWVMTSTARSSIFREAHDYSCFITNDRGEVLTQAFGLPIHTGSGSFAIKRLREYWQDDIYERDLFILNDPYFAGGNHLPDWTLIAPIFIEGNIVAFACNRSHQLDVGGGRLGSQNSEATEIFHEGVRLPPLKLFEGGRLRQDIFDLLIINTRYPDRIADDVWAMIGSVRIGVDRLGALATKFGPIDFTRICDLILDDAEVQAGQEIAKIPDGVYRATELMNNDVFSDKPVSIQLALHVNGSKIVADFSGSSAQIQGFKNSPFSNTFSAACIGLGTLFPLYLRRNSGTFRPLSLVAPEGSVVNPQPPAPVGVCTCYPAWDIIHCVWRALNQALPQPISAGWGKTSAPVTVGFHNQNRPYVMYHWGAQPGSGAVNGRDGRNTSGDLPALGGHVFPSLEAYEQLYPVRFLKQEFRLDSSGAGRYRGGSGLDYQVEHLAVVRYNLRGEGNRTPSGFGVAGGLDGTKAETWVLLLGEKEWQELPQYDVLDFPKGSLFWLLSSGGGGYGDPLLRDPQAVRRDVQDEFVSLEMAQDVYGVIIQPDQ